MRVIRRFARQVAERFGPEKIILFGSHAYGTPHEDNERRARGRYGFAGRTNGAVPWARRG